MAYAPQAIQQLYNVIQSRISGAQLGGIVGDVNHSFGYHLARTELPSTDYSVVLPLDQQGDPGAASALDVTLGEGSPLMITCTNRLLVAAKAGDRRLKALREFCGTTDGQNTHPYDLSNGQDGPLNSWDSSHLFHVHLSFYRAYCNDYAAIAPIADVFTGHTAAPDSSSITPLSEEDEMANYPYIIYDKSNPANAAVVDVGGVSLLRDGDSVQGMRAALHCVSVPLGSATFKARIQGAK